MQTQNLTNLICVGSPSGRYLHESSNSTNLISRSLSHPYTLFTVTHVQFAVTYVQFAVTYVQFAVTYVQFCSHICAIRITYVQFAVTYVQFAVT